jgi:nicotinamidase-related amidase
MNKLSKMLLAMSVVLALCIPALAQKPSSELLSPTNHALVMIDFQGQMAFATTSIDITSLRTNAALLSGGSKIFKIPTVITAVNTKTFSGPYFSEIQEVYPQTTIPYIERTTMNSWEDVNAYKAIVGKNKKKIVLAGLWTSVCIVGPALSAIAEGYEVYVISDACGDVSKEAHEMAMQRMIKAGVHPMTSIQYVLELQRDWSRSETYGAVTELIKKYGGAYGVGIQYAHDMLKH